MDIFGLLLTSVSGQSESSVASFTGSSFLVCCMASIVLGLITACVYMFKQPKYSKSFVCTLAMLPIIVQMVIVIVNGNIGAGIAVMGVFNLVRFRSIPGNAKDIGSVFAAMAIGLATGMGFVWLAAAFTVIISILNVAYSVSPLGAQKIPSKTLKISVPEDMAFDGAFDQILMRYCDEFELESVSTSNMGSIFEMVFDVRQKEANNTKKMIDDIRVKNGNLRVVLMTRQERERL